MDETTAQNLSDLTSEELVEILERHADTLGRELKLGMKAPYDPPGFPSLGFVRHVRMLLEESARRFGSTRDPAAPRPVRPVGADPAAPDRPTLHLPDRRANRPGS